MAEERTPVAGDRNERDRPVPRSESDRPAHGGPLKDHHTAPSDTNAAPPHAHDMDQPGMNPDDNADGA